MYLRRLFLVRRTARTIRFSGELLGPYESAQDRMNRSDGVPILLGVHSHPVHPQALLARC